MGKGTDKLYITHSEWASEDAYSANAGSGLSKSNAPDTTFKRLPFNFCALSLQPFKSPVCTTEGAIFDTANLLPWLSKHGTNPVDGQSLRATDLIELHFLKNDEGEMVDPVTYKVFTDNTHIVAVGKTGNVYAWDTVERLNVKAKMWRDLLSEVEFGRKDIITLQDPLNVKGRNLSEFKYLREGVNTLTEEQQRERSAGVNKSALGNAASVLKDKDAAATPATPQIGKYLHQQPSSPSLSTSLTKAPSTNGTPKSQPLHTSKAIPYNAAQHTTGQAAASFTSTGLTPHTGGDLALLSDEEYMLKPRRVKKPGYARIATNHGDINLELLPEFAPKAVWNFVQLSKKGYYGGVVFHRNIRNFMLQGGDPTGTGKGGSSVWNKNFADEFDGPLSHDARGIVSMANKGKNTNSSQFFITYRPCKHLDRKHTIFARVVGGMETLSAIENVEVSESDKRPLEDVKMDEVVVFLDPFEEFLKEKGERDREVEEREEVRKAGGREDERTTWTGKRVRGGASESAARAPAVGKYMAGAGAGTGEGKGQVLAEWESGEPERKKQKAGGFGNFDAW
ncbi:MAG: Peptidyl-prolyl cis-trans isomerase cyp8 [Alectoria sarmentosa]|nr:MAG: Peptidyl-prolyl cis-trans isomerase cyp8 [Alectoria sarmentosa]